MNWTSLVYIELSHDGFSARNLYKNNITEHSNTDSLRFPPEDINAAFGHPRLIVADYVKAERLLFTMIRALCQHDIFRPLVIVRVTHRFVDDISLVEKRALIDVVVRAGARRAYLWIGRALTDPEILKFPKTAPQEGIVINELDFLQITKQHPK